jgi:hypothetical protein
VEIVGLILVLLNLACYVWLAFLQKDANAMTKQSLDLNQRSLGLAQKGNDLNQKSLGLTEKSVTLTQQSADLTKQAFKTSHIPWISADELTIGDPQDGKITISVSVKNNSDTPAFKVTFEMSYLDNRMNADASNPTVDTVSNGAATWMPNNSYTFFGTVTSTDAQSFKDGVENGDIVFSTVITYSDIFGGQITLRETWNKQNGRFVNPASTVDYPDYSKP